MKKTMLTSALFSASLILSLLLGEMLLRSLTGLVDPVKERNAASRDGSASEYKDHSVTAH